MRIRELLEIADDQPDRQVMNPQSQKTSITQYPQFQTWFRGSRIVDQQGQPLQVYHGTTAPEDFSEFSVGHSRSGSGADPRTFLGSHFAQDPHVAGKFAGGLYGGRLSNVEHGRILPVYLRILKPYVTSDSAMLDAMLDGIYNDDAVFWVLDDTASSNNEDPAELRERYEADDEFRKEVNEEALTLVEAPDFTLSREMAAVYRARIMKAGYDGIIYENEIEGGTSYIVFDPRQVKSAMNVGTFGLESPNISEGRRSLGE